MIKVNLDALIPREDFEIEENIISHMRVAKDQMNWEAIAWPNDKSTPLVWNEWYNDSSRGGVHYVSCPL